MRKFMLGLGLLILLTINLFGYTETYITAKSSSTTNGTDTLMISTTPCEVFGIIISSPSTTGGTFTINDSTATTGGTTSVVNAPFDTTVANQFNFYAKTLRGLRCVNTGVGYVTIFYRKITN